MTEKYIYDLFHGILRRNTRPFMTVSSFSAAMGTPIRRQIGISELKRGVDIRKRLEQLVGDEFMFIKKGNIHYILEPCEPADLILAELSDGSVKTPKVIARLMPFTKIECVKIINNLIEDGRIKVIFSKEFDSKICIAENDNKAQNHKFNISIEEFKRAFDENNHGRIFVRICDIRKTLKWPREIFDKTLRDLRDQGVIQLHVGNVSTMTPDEVKDCFIDENNLRMGSVTWNVR